MDPCKVCGGTDATLVDGFYYCVECGTQDVNVQETVVEQTAMADGTFAHATVKKFTVATEDGIEMSGEWHKWHVFNFILAGLTDELITLGAKPSVKMKVLWIWSRYVKCFQVKDASESKNKLNIDDDDDDDDDDYVIKSRGDINQDSGNSDSDVEAKSKSKSKKAKTETFARDIKNISRSTLLTILYVALNLDRSNIQLSHLLRFVREGHLSLMKCMKYVPKELNITIIRNWKSFILSHTNFTPITIRALAMTFFKRLKLGLPSVPNFRKLVNNYVQELCLPADVTSLVIGLMHYIPIDFLDIDHMSQKGLVRVPDYEGVCMGYILVGLKMCFGLDGDYELRLSDEVKEINDEENHLKSYKLGMVSEPCDRLFSFKEWCQHLQFRKSMLCKYYLPMSRQFNVIPDDYVFMEHLEKRKNRDIKLSDDVTMDILNKIQPGEGEEETFQIIPKDEFRPTLTPLTSYVEVIAQYVQNPDLRLLLCEDFTQYSLKYAIENLKLPSSDKVNPVVGVSESGKIFNNHVIGTLNVKEGDMSLIYVRNCENKNWLKTNPPAVDHVTKASQSEITSEKESDYGYDSNAENSLSESFTTPVTISDESANPSDKKLEIIEVLDESKCIFDDDFKDITMVSSNDDGVTVKEETLDKIWEIDTQSNISIQDSKVNSFNNIEHHEDGEISTIQFDPSSCDREKMISELIELARKNYKIPAPKENTVREPRKRKTKLINDEASCSEPKKKRIVNRSKPGETKDAVNRLICAYYSNLEGDILNQVSEHVKTLIGNVNSRNDVDTANLLDSTNELNVLDCQNSLNLSKTVLNSGENAESVTEININNGHDNIAEKNDEDINSTEQIPGNVTLNDHLEDEIVDEIRKSDPNFDEENHDIKQLYVRLGDSLDVLDVSIANFENDPEIDKIIQKKIDEFSNTTTSVLHNNKVDNDIPDFDTSDSDDDVPLITLKDTLSNELEKNDRRKEKLEPLIRDPASVQKFNYWVRHYKSRCVVRSTDIAKKFDLELSENLPVSFVLVIRECAELLGSSMFSIYKNMQNIEALIT